MTHLLTHLLNYEPVYRTAPTTPGLLISHSEMKPRAEGVRSEMSEKRERRGRSDISE